MVRTVSLNVRGNDTPTPSISGAEFRDNNMRGHTDRIREDGFVVEDILSPVHEGVDILGRGKLRGALVAHAVFPEIFVSDFGGGVDYQRSED